MKPRWIVCVCVLLAETGYGGTPGILGVGNGAHKRVYKVWFEGSEARNKRWWEGLEEGKHFLKRMVLSVATSSHQTFPVWS